MKKTKQINYYLLIAVMTIKSYLPIIWTILKEDVPFGWYNFFENFRLWRKLIAEKNIQMNQTQLDKKIGQFLRKKLTKSELKEMEIKPRSLILTIRNFVERYLLIILDSIFVDVPFGWYNFFENFRLWRKLIAEKNIKLINFWKDSFWCNLNFYRE